MQPTDITDKIRQHYESKRTVYPQSNIRASSIGHPCLRYLVLSITNWQDSAPPDYGLMPIFSLGNTLEAHVITTLKDSGLEITTTRKNFKIPNPLITGRSDAMIQDPETGEMIVCEIKGLAPLTFDSINTAEDMLRHKRHYVRKYPAQLQIYLYHHAREYGFFILFNKISGAIKVIKMPLDYEYTESLLQKAERVYAHIGAGTLPDGCDDESVCDDCALSHVCGAKIDRGDALIDTGELEELLQRREKLLPAVREFDSNRKLIKYAMRGRSRAFTASYYVQKKTVIKRPFIVAGSVYSREIIKKIGGS